MVLWVIRQTAMLSNTKCANSGDHYCTLFVSHVWAAPPKQKTDSSSDHFVFYKIAEDHSKWRIAIYLKLPATVMFLKALVFIATDCLTLQSSQVKTKLRLKLKTFYFLQAFQIVHRWHCVKYFKSCLFYNDLKTTQNVLKWMIKIDCKLGDNIIHDVLLSLYKENVNSFIQFLH